MAWRNPGYGGPRRGNGGVEERILHLEGVKRGGFRELEVSECRIGGLNVFTYELITFQSSILSCQELRAPICNPMDLI
jgi:hypothetical protein